MSSVYLFRVGMANADNLDAHFKKILFECLVEFSFLKWTTEVL